ncbi:hypothetical protein [Puia sp.]|jgi:hypothetical protein|uniref:hypothetical protein n=1 Tax=Puia sp. TaxID=2045100 RepID=UPI002F3EE5AE
MQQNNLDFLNENLKYLGFGERSLLNQHLEAQILRDPPSFELYTEAFYESETKLEAKLCFTRSARDDFYFFNKYEALLRYAGEPDKDRRQTFYINKGQGITFKEAFNLLQGRAVFKLLTSRAGIQYSAWIQLNFGEKDKRDNYVYSYFRGHRFDLEKALGKYVIREMAFEDLRTNLFRSLQRGNLHPVIFEGPEYNGKHLIEANPLLNSINIYPAATRVVGAA